MRRMSPSWTLRRTNGGRGITIAHRTLMCVPGVTREANRWAAMKVADASMGHAPLAALSQIPRPGILLDRDGTIIVDHGYVGSTDRVDFIDGAPEAIASFNRAGLPVALVTNQAGVARGLYSIEDVALVHRYIAERLAERGAHIDLFLFCPYHPDGVIEAFARTSEDRKPRPGMAKAAEAALNLDLTASWVVGDRQEDIGLAEAVGAAAVYIGPERWVRPRVWSFPTLAAAAPHILERVAV
jgi:D,D-heptose 1,7-bisphosphate phosphatase